MPEFHERLKKIMKERGITQTELCMRTGIPKSAMCQYISGSFRPKQERTRLIANALNVSEGWLMGYENEKEKETEIDEDRIKFALFNGMEGVTDEMYEEVKKFAEMVRLREEVRRKE